MNTSGENCYCCQTSKGFTLVELAVVLVIVGLLASSLIGAYSLYVKKAQVQTTQDNIKEAKKALYAFQSDADHAHFPCPAKPTDPEARSDCSITPVTAPNGEPVLIGVMPAYDPVTNTTIVSQQEALDGFGRRLTYAVTQRMTTGLAGDANAPSSIQVNNLSGPGHANESFVVLSHGPDGRGGYTPKGKLVKACDATSKDAQNCDFITDTTTNAAIFVDNTNNRSMSKGANSSDDFVGTSTVAAETQECAAGTELRGFNPTTGRVICKPRGIACGPDEALVGVKNAADGSLEAVCGPVNKCAAGLVLAETSSASAGPVCVQNLPGNCGTGHVQYGTNADGTPQCANIMTNCPESQVLVGVSDRTPICGIVPNNFNTACGPNTIQIGNNPDGTAKCRAVTCAAGTYFRGLNWDGSEICSGDQTASGNCPLGQYVTGIGAGGVVNCAYLPTQVDIGLEFVETNCPRGIGTYVSTNGYGDFFTCVATCPAGKKAISGSCWVDGAHATSSSAIWGDAAWECSSAMDYGDFTQANVRVRATCANVR